MPQIPYNPVPSVSPSGTPTPQLHVNTPVEAFGGAVARAFQGLGNTMEGAGNELFHRAVAMQQLKNETEVNEQATNYMLSAGKKHDGYMEQRGKNAVDGLDAHMQDLQQSRQAIRNSLSSDAVRREFDKASMSTMGYYMRHASGHAAAEQKRWSVGASNANLDAAKQSVFAAPEDEQNFQNALRSIDRESNNIADLLGQSPEQRNNEIFKHRSEIIARKAEALSLSDPLKAKEFLEANRLNLHYDDLHKADRAVSGGMHTTGERNISNAVEGGWGAYMTQHDIDKAAGVQEPLTRIVKQAQRDAEADGFKFTVTSGKRTVQQQEELFRQGRTQTVRGSNHLVGRAIDLEPIGPDGKPLDTKEAHEKLEGYMKAAAEKLQIPLGPEHDKIKGWDPYHYSLPREYDVATAPKPVEEPLGSKQARAVAQAKAIDPNDTIFHDGVVAKVDTQHHAAVAARRDTEFAANQTIANALVEAQLADKPIISKEALVATSPQVAAAWDQIEPTKQLQYVKQFERLQRVVEDDTVRQKYVGMEPHELAGVNPMEIAQNKSLSARSKREILREQMKAIKAPQGDPRLNHALSLLPEIPLDIMRDPESRQIFKGQLLEALIQEQGRKNAPLNTKEIRDIGSILLQKEVIKHRWLFPDEVGPKAMLPITEEEMAVAKAHEIFDVFRAAGREPTEDEVRTWAVRQRLRRWLHPKEK